MSRECCVIVYGDLLLDILFYLEENVSIDRRAHIIKRVIISPGGAAGNIAVALSRLKIPVYVISTIGIDPIGEYLLSTLVNENVGVDYIKKIKETYTGVTIGFIEPSGHRTLFTYKGASEKNTIRAREFSSILDRLMCVQLVFISGYTIHNEDRGESIINIASEASKHGVLVAIDLGGFKQEHNKILSELRGKLNYLFLNEEELLEITGSMNVNDGLEALYEIITPHVIFLKQGEKGCLIRGRNIAITIPAYRVHVVDTTGCGDVFNAGVLYGILKGYSISNAAKLGSLLAAYKATGYGAQHLPRDLDELLNFERILSNSESF